MRISLVPAIKSTMASKLPPALLAYIYRYVMPGYAFAIRSKVRRSVGPSRVSTSKYAAPGKGERRAWDDDVVLQVPLYAYALTQLREGKIPVTADTFVAADLNIDEGNKRHCPDFLRSHLNTEH